MAKILPQGIAAQAARVLQEAVGLSHVRVCVADVIISRDEDGIIIVLDKRNAIQPNTCEYYRTLQDFYAAYDVPMTPPAPIR